MKITVTQTHDFPLRKRYVIELCNEAGEVVSHGNFHLVRTAFGDGFVDTMLCSGVETPMQHRRHGYVRRIFDYALEWAAAQGVAVSLLHPFSFSYYEKFGYGKVADHLIVRLPIRLLDTVPRCCDLLPMEDTPEGWQELYDLHNTFCRRRQLMLQHSDPMFLKRNKEIWIFRENGKATGYIGFETEKTLKVNHYEDGVIRVSHIVYTTPTALKALLGFIRMYEGELDDVEFGNLAMCPEAIMYLRHDTHTHYQLLPDLMARVLNTEKMLLAHRYPLETGSFRLRVNDTLPSVRGSFLVEYAAGKAQVSRLEENAPVDLTVGVSMLSRLIYGYDGLTAQQAAFVDDISLEGNAEDFFRAFGKKASGVFEHF